MHSAHDMELLAAALGAVRRPCGRVREVLEAFEAGRLSFERLLNELRRPMTVPSTETPERVTQGLLC